MINSMYETIKVTSNKNHFNIKCFIKSDFEVPQPQKEAYMMKVLVSDPLSDVGVEIFQETPGIDVDVNIGRIVADRAKGMKMKVIVYDPYIKPETVEKLDLEPVSLDELLQRADYITIHTPKTDETTNMINRETIAKMKKGAILINCARGGIASKPACRQCHCGDSNSLFRHRNRIRPGAFDYGHA